MECPSHGIRQSEEQTIKGLNCNYSIDLRLFIDEFAINDSGRQLFSASMIEKMLENPEIHYFVYSDHQQMIGVIAYKNPAHLVHFFISKEKQAQGIGRTMWDFIFAGGEKSLVFQYLR